MEMYRRMAQELARTGKTTSELAKLCGVTKLTARNWLKGKTMPQAESFFTLCKELGLDMNWIILGKKTEGTT